MKYMFKHKVNSKNWEKFKSFTGHPYYDYFYHKKAYPNKHFRYNFKNSKESFIYLAYWIDNYKRLNSLYNKINAKYDSVNKKRLEAYDSFLSKLKEYKQNNAVVLHINGLLYFIEYDKKVSWSIRTPEWHVKDYITCDTNENISYIQGNTKELEELFTEFIKYDTNLNKVVCTLAKVKTYYVVVLEHIIKHKIMSKKEIENSHEYEFNFKLKVDSNEFFAKIIKQEHGYFKVEIDFCRNNFELIL